MNLWRTLQEQLRETFIVMHEDRASTQLSVTLPGRERSWVTLQSQQTAHQPWVRLTAPVCAEYLMNPRTALGHNAGLAIGALATQGGTCVLTQLLPLDGLDRRQAAAAIALLVHEAARLRRALSPRGTQREAPCTPAVDESITSPPRSRSPAA